MMAKNIYLVIAISFFTSCSAQFESTSEERKMDYVFEQELVKELNKIRAVKGLPQIQRHRSVKKQDGQNPFDAQMRRGY